MVVIATGIGATTFTSNGTCSLGGKIVTSSGANFADGAASNSSGIDTSTSVNSDG